MNEMYKIVHGSSPADLSRHVSYHMEFGWRPVGNVFQERKQELFWNEWEWTNYFYQSMIKENV